MTAVRNLHVISPDTSPQAAAAQLAAYRAMSPTRRVALAAEMSTASRNMTLAGIRHRHPEYDECAARFALFRLLHGDAVFRRVWPNAPVLAP